MKSSSGRVGESDRENAQKRELVTAAIADHVNEILLRDGNDYAVLVAGDFNVGETDTAKNGRVLGADHVGSDAGDRYDDTHAILSAGLIGGLQMTSLTKSLGKETYVGAAFPGTGPIDVIYVAGPSVSQFTLAGAGRHAYGSDHLPVFTTFGVSGVPPITPPPTPPGLTISALLPNPEGLDEGHEWVKLRNMGNADMDLDGWFLVDQAGHEHALHGTIPAGGELKIDLAARELPLNNAGGDEIRLVKPTPFGRPLDVSCQRPHSQCFTSHKCFRIRTKNENSYTIKPGGNVEDVFAYTGQQAIPWQEIRRNE